MKICILSLLETAEPQFRKVLFSSNQINGLLIHAQCDNLSDPTQCIPRHRHEFVNRKITGSNAKSEIDEVCRENFDVFMNCMVRRSYTSYVGRWSLTRCPGCRQIWH